MATNKFRFIEHNNFLYAFIFGLLFSTQAAGYSQGDWILKSGLAMIPDSPNLGISTSNSTFSSQFKGATLQMKGDTQPTFSVAHMLTDHAAVEFNATLPFNHDFMAGGSFGQLGKVGSLKEQSINLFAQYYFNEFYDDFRPFIGIGFNQTRFSDIKIDQSFNDYVNSIKPLGILTVTNARTTPHITSENSIVYQAGADWQINDNWYLNTTLWYVKLNIDMSFTLDFDLNGSPKTVDFSAAGDINPVIVMLGAGIVRRF